MISGGLAGLVGALVFVLFVGLLILYAVLGRRWPTVFRPIAGYEALGRAIERAVEGGERVHLSLGTGSVTGAESAPALAGLAVLGRVAAATTMSDRPAVVTAADGAMMILAQDTLRSAYRRVGASDRYQATSARMLGPTPYSYVAGLPTLLATEDVSVHMLIGSFGAEGALAADFGERQQKFVLAGTDDIQTQALLYATAENALIGEEVFAGGAYLNVGPLHPASLRAQDAVRLLIIVAILVGTLVRTIMGLL
jgi:hypothetical protein